MTPPRMTIGNLAAWIASHNGSSDKSEKTSTTPRVQYPQPPTDGRCIINELPPELLSYVFDLGIQIQAEDPDVPDSDSESDSSDSGSRQKPFEVLVSHVCKLWREVAINQPTLWNVIPLNIQGDLKGIRHAKVLLATYLERAREAPLDIAIDLGEFPTFNPDGDEDEDGTNNGDLTRDTWPEYAQLQKMIDMVVPRHKQLRSFEVIVSDFFLMAAALKVIESIPEAPLLEALSLYNHDDFEDMRFFEPSRFTSLRVLPFHGKAPRLKNVALWGVHLDWEQASLLLFKDLEELELAYHPEDVRPTYKQYARILTQSPNLRTLALSHSGPAGGMVEWSENVREDSSSDASLISIPRITLLSLKSLVLSYEDSENYIRDLMDYLDIPNVTELTLDLAAEDDTEFFRRISTAPPKGRSLLQGLTHLKITDCSCNVEVIYSALQSLENVVLLNLNFNYLDHSWLELLMGESPIVPNPRIPCPKLEELMLRGIDGTDVVVLARKRKEAGFPLKKVSMEETDALDEEDELELKKLVELDYFEGSDTEDDEDDDSEDFYIGLDEDELDEFDEGDLTDEDVEEDDGDAEWTDEDSEDLHFLD